MTAKGFGLAGLVEGGRLTGIITDGDLRRNMDGLMARNAGEVATRGPKVIRIRSLASEALHEMNSRKISALFVLDDEDRVAGLLHIQDCLRAGLRSKKTRGLENAYLTMKRSRRSRTAQASSSGMIAHRLKRFLRKTSIDEPVSRLSFWQLCRRPSRTARRFGAPLEEPNNCTLTDRACDEVTAHRNRS